MKQKLILLGLMVCLYCHLSAQKQSITINGTVHDSMKGEPVRGASVTIRGARDGTLSNDKGSFRISAQTSLPAVLIISYSGFETKEIVIEKPSDDLSIVLSPSGLLEEVEITGVNKVKMKRMLAPVSIEHLGYRHITQLPAPDYYSNLLTLKGADVTTTSLTFKTISTRGFNGSGSSRVNQLVDGMDNQAPGLNFFVGNFAGLTELDVENMELLPGASSALYGPGGMNGTILINSKNPFKYQGLSILAKQGIMHVGKQQRDRALAYYDYSLRWAKAFNDKVAFKIGAQYLQGNDWLANDSTNYQRNGNSGKTIAGNRATDPNYDGVNVYGDETSLDLRLFMAGALPAGHPLLQSPMMVSRTGFQEKDVIDPVTKNIKLSGAVHYRLNSKLEAQLMGYWATGNSVYTGNNRYVLKGIKIGQYKVELKHANWFLRSYTTQEDAGEAYTATVTSQYMNEAWKRSFNPSNIMGSWYPQYTGAFLQALGAGAPMAQAHQIARAFADQGRPVPGTAAFNQIFDAVRKTPISKQGGLFLEKSQLWMTEGQYDLSDKIKFVNVIIGGNWKKYILNSEGTLFIDTIKPITFREVGAYAQVSKSLFSNFLNLSFAGRYDKNEDFKGKFTPRATSLIRIAKNNHLRFSYQTAYRFPTTQHKYIGLNVGAYTLVGGLPWIMDYMQTQKNPVIEVKNGIPESTPWVYKEFKPESMRSFEVGYKGLISNKLLIDAYAYVGQYKDFLGRNVLYQPGTGRTYSAVVNSTTKVKTYGFGAGVDYRMKKNFSLFANAYSDVITDVPAGFQAYFNTPKYRINAGIGNDGLGRNKRIGFNVVWRWQDGFFSDGDLASGPVKAFSTIDAQVSYRVAKKSQIKLGGSNILNHYYQNSFGNPKVGGLYYLGFGFNVL